MGEPADARRAPMMVVTHEVTRIEPTAG